MKPPQEIDVREAEIQTTQGLRIATLIAVTIAFRSEKLTNCGKTHIG
ncbi:hypothetical protein NIES25_52170 [Nostoc linckia NIES-25]|nr:hypothetical protein NIES25_52170 [Nostoc linckia NIES-25]